ncbi:MAG: hypothetical protein C0410_13280 [Anaerolinea sp.]|nr:hypothetical protein [Anaerolinea sp.]
MKPIAVVSNSTFIDNGLAEIFGQELSELNPGLDGSESTLLNLKASAIRQLGLAETRGMFVRAGRAAFYYWMREYAESLGWREVEFRLLSAPARIKRTLTDLLKWFEEEKFLTGELSSTDEAWLVSVPGLVGEGARLECNFFIGMLQEMVSWAGAGKFYPAREIECQSTGIEHCVFEISKLSVG